MKRIDRDTVRRVLDAADIVEVVSDFVSLKKRGANYVGLCPFHNERTPSFSVSRAKGICKCFSCGKGGSAVNFVMELEQISFAEAVRYLASKYGIPVEEKEMTEQERQEQTDRENMLGVNDFAMRHYEHTLSQTQEGRDIGMAYFRHRGINEQMVRRFHLGYALGRGDLRQAAADHGYSERYLLETGLCLKGDHGIYDRFRGRVIYPVHTLSGKVVAFGARTLKTDKTVAKYVNSPESAIYQKRRELYGMYQAKQAVSRLDKCILVEGYMDVISMHQAGVENVVASSGTSLTVEQIAAIRRFTRNITVVYDADAAGIKASLRSIDLLLEASMNVRILQLPPGEDPDSFAQGNSSSQVTDYLSTHEEDFITFKARTLMASAQDDPARRASAIRDIVGSIAAIPDQITRNVYVQQCGAMFRMDDRLIGLEVANARGQRMRRTGDQEQAREPERVPVAVEEDEDEAKVRLAEQELLRLVVKYALAEFPDPAAEPNADGEIPQVSVLEFVRSELEADSLALSDPRMAALLDQAGTVAGDLFPAAWERENRRLQAERSQRLQQGTDQIRRQGTDVADINAREAALLQQADQEYRQQIDEFAASYVSRELMSSPDDDIRTLATELATDSPDLERAVGKGQALPAENQRLDTLMQAAVSSLKFYIIQRDLHILRLQLRDTPPDQPERQMKIMAKIRELEQVRSALSPHVGYKVIASMRKSGRN